MATNPMQRKAKISFFLGMLIMLLITGAIIAVLFMQLMNKTKKEQEQLRMQKNVYVLKQDVSSGQVITSDMMDKKSVNADLIPSNATSDISLIQNYALQDKEGNDIGTIYDKNKNTFLYMKKGDKDCLVEKEMETDDNYYLQKDEENNYIYIKKDNNENVALYIEKDGEHEIKLDDQTGNYYYEVNRRQTQLNINKEYIELNSVPLVAKITMKKNTVMTTELVSKSDNIVQNDVRKQEYNMLVLPMDLVTGDYIDIRLMLPSGQDYIVVAKKEVTIPDANGVNVEDTIWVNLSEDEILHMSCAIIDAYQVKGAKLYATKYTEAGMQEAATPTYPVNESTLTLLRRDPNVLERAKSDIINRYNRTNGDNLRNDYINSVINAQGEQTQSNIETNMQESITNSKNSRKEYLDSLAGVVK